MNATGGWRVGTVAQETSILRFLLQRQWRP